MSHSEHSLVERFYRLDGNVHERLKELEIRYPVEFELKCTADRIDEEVAYVHLDDFIVRVESSGMDLIKAVSHIIRQSDFSRFIHMIENQIEHVEKYIENASLEVKYI